MLRILSCESFCWLMWGSLVIILTAQGETSVVKAWHLRPSLIWKDGKWVEWFSVRNDCSFHEVLSLDEFHALFSLIAKTSLLILFLFY